MDHSIVHIHSIVFIIFRQIIILCDVLPQRMMTEKKKHVLRFNQ